MNKDSLPCKRPNNEQRKRNLSNIVLFEQVLKTFFEPNIVKQN